MGETPQSRKAREGSTNMRQSIRIALNWHGISRQPQAWILFSILGVATGVMTSMAFADPPAAESDHPKTSRHDMPTDAKVACLAALNAANRAINLDPAAAWGDFLLGMREAPPEVKGHAEAIKSLNKAAELAGQLPEKDSRKIKSIIERLRRLDAACVAIGKAGGATGSTEDAALLDAATNLAEYLDDSNARLAESARLWQAVCYWRAGKSDRALVILRPIVSAPFDPRIGLVSRLFRCRVLAETGLNSAALAQCTRIAENANRWFENQDEDTRQGATNTIRLVQIDIYKAWIKQRRDAGDAQGADAAAALFEAFMKKAPESTAPRLRLIECIGGMPSMNGLTEASPESKPTTTPAEGDSD